MAEATELLTSEERETLEFYASHHGHSHQLNRLLRAYDSLLQQVEAEKAAALQVGYQWRIERTARESLVRVVEERLQEIRQLSSAVNHHMSALADERNAREQAEKRIDIDGGTIVQLTRRAQQAERERGAALDMLTFERSHSAQLEEWLKTRERERDAALARVKELRTHNAQCGDVIDNLRTELDASETALASARAILDDSRLFQVTKIERLTALLTSHPAPVAVEDRFRAVKEKVFAVHCGLLASLKDDPTPVALHSASAEATRGRVSLPEAGDEEQSAAPSPEKVGR